MKKTMLLNLLLAVALLWVSVSLVRLKSSQSAAPANAGEVVVSSLMSRTSIRRFTNQPVSSDTINLLLKAAMAAPTARNMQPWHFVVVNDTAQIAALGKTSRHSGPLQTATLVIAVCGDMDKTMEGDGQAFWIQDVSAATENLLLAAHAVELGAVWTGAYPIKDRVQAISEVLSLPETVVPLALVAIGYPAESPQPKDKWKEENVSWNTFGGTNE